eukprot:2436590-Rhodomonas_salina.2
MNTGIRFQIESKTTKTKTIRSPLIAKLTATHVEGGQALGHGQMLCPTHVLSVEARVLMLAEHACGLSMLMRQLNSCARFMWH